MKCFKTPPVKCLRPLMGFLKNASSSRLFMQTPYTLFLEVKTEDASSASPGAANGRFDNESPCEKRKDFIHFRRRRRHASDDKITTPRRIIRGDPLREERRETL
jgi:hypothetical protein